MPITYMLRLMFFFIIYLPIYPSLYLSINPSNVFDTFQSQLQMSVHFPPNTTSLLSCKIILHILDASLCYVYIYIYIYLMNIFSNLWLALSFSNGVFKSAEILNFDVVIIFSFIIIKMLF